MKLLLTLISLVFLSAAAFGQTFQYRPTAYTQPFVSTINSSAAAQTYLGLPSPTNTALLNINQTWTGTPTFPAAVFSANNVTFRTLYSAPTNLFFATINTNATSATYTNAGDFQNCTSLLKVSMPPLLGSNSMVFVCYGSETTNANTSTCVLTAYAGSATNFIGDATPFRLTPAGSTYSSQNGPGLFVFANQASFTNQIGNRASFTTKVPAEHLFGRTSFCDTSTNWTLYLGLTTTGNHTNLHVTTLSVIELVKN